MHIVVCLKQVLDPEITPRYFQIDPATNRPVNEDSDMVLDSFAENALELAIQLRDKTPGATVTALCLGEESAEDVLRRALAFTADAAVRSGMMSGKTLMVRLLDIFLPKQSRPWVVPRLS